MTPEKEPKPRSPSPQRDPIFIWATPDRRDLIFYVERDGKLPKNQTWAYGQAFEDAVTYPNHKLALVTEQTAEEWSRWYYVKDREAQHEYNWGYTQADIGGQKFDAVTRTYVIPRSEYSNGGYNPTPSEMETGETAGSLVNRKIERIGQKELDSLFVVVVNTYAALATLVRFDYDQAYGCLLRTAQTLVPRGEDGPEPGVDGNVVTEVQDLTSRWTMVVEREVVCDALLAGVSYNTTVKYPWPAVLSGIRVDVWNLRQGGAETYTTPIFSRNAYNGPCAAEVFEQWSKDPFGDITPPDVLFPMPVDLNTPLFSMSVSPSLHGTITVDVSTGTTHPKYEYTAGEFEFPETTATIDGDTDVACVDWPASLVISSEQERFRGGFLKREITISAPGTSA